jgi:predicted enzyme related to lactoylglutathione lyase
MKIKMTSVLVDDQQKALEFYTSVLGFVKKVDQPAGEFRWLTVVSPDGPDDVELLLEPNENPAALTAVAVDDVQAEFERLSALGVRFTMDPTPMGPTTAAIFDDTCGNLIQIYEG